MNILDEILENDLSLFNASDGHKLVEAVRRKRGLAQQPNRIFGDNEPLAVPRKSLNIQVHRLEDTASTSTQAVVDEQNKTRKSLNFMSVSGPRRPLLRDFDKFHPGVYSTPVATESGHMLLPRVLETTVFNGISPVVATETTNNATASTSTSTAKANTQELMLKLQQENEKLKEILKMQEQLKTEDDSNSEIIDIDHFASPPRTKSAPVENTNTLTINLTPQQTKLVQSRLGRTPQPNENQLTLRASPRLPCTPRKPLTPRQSRLAAPTTPAASTSKQPQAKETPKTALSENRIVIIPLNRCDKPSTPVRATTPWYTPSKTPSTVAAAEDRLVTPQSHRRTTSKSVATPRMLHKNWTNEQSFRNSSPSSSPSPNRFQSPDRLITPTKDRQRAQHANTQTPKGNCTIPETQELQVGEPSPKKPKTPSKRMTNAASQTPRKSGVEKNRRITRQSVLSSPEEVVAKSKSRVTRQSVLSSPEQVITNRKSRITRQSVLSSPEQVVTNRKSRVTRHTVVSPEEVMTEDDDEVIQTPPENNKKIPAPFASSMKTRRSGQSPVSFRIPPPPQFSKTPAKANNDHQSRSPRRSEFSSPPPPPLQFCQTPIRAAALPDDEGIGRRTFAVVSDCRTVPEERMAVETAELDETPIEKNKEIPPPFASSRKTRRSGQSPSPSKGPPIQSPPRLSNNAMLSDEEVREINNISGKRRSAEDNRPASPKRPRKSSNLSTSRSRTSLKRLNGSRRSDRATPVILEKIAEDLLNMQNETLDVTNNLAITQSQMPSPPSPFNRTKSQRVQERLIGDGEDEIVSMRPAARLRRKARSEQLIRYLEVSKQVLSPPKKDSFFISSRRLYTKGASEDRYGNTPSRIAEAEGRTVEETPLPVEEEDGHGESSRRKRSQTRPRQSGSQNRSQRLRESFSKETDTNDNRMEESNRRESHVSVDKTQKEMQNIAAQNAHLAEDEEQEEIAPVLITPKKKKPKAPRTKKKSQMVDTSSSEIQETRKTTRVRRPPIAYWSNKIEYACTLYSLSPVHKKTAKAKEKKEEKKKKPENEKKNTKGRAKRIIASPSPERCVEPVVVEAPADEEPSSDTERIVKKPAEKKTRQKKKKGKDISDSESPAIDPAEVVVEEEVFKKPELPVKKKKERAPEAAHSTTSSELSAIPDNPDNHPDSRTAAYESIASTCSLFPPNDQNPWIRKIINHSNNSAESTTSGSVLRCMEADGLQAVSVDDLIFQDKDGIGYAFYTTNDECKVGYLKMPPGSFKKRSRVKRDNLNFVVMVGESVEFTTNGKSTQFQNGDFVKIALGSQYTIRNTAEVTALLMVMMK